MAAEVGDKPVRSPHQASSGQAARARRPTPLALLAAVIPLFFVSGFTGLVYEVTWTRMFTAVFGNTTYAVSAVLTAFLGGLALGSVVIGRGVDRLRHPLKLLAGLELGVALSALAVPVVLRWLDGLYSPLYLSFPDSTWLLLAAKVLLSFAVMLVPTFLMGGTLPVLSRVLVRRTEQSGVLVAVLYAVNTLGATAGCFLTGFWFLESLGVAGTIRWTAATNLLLAVAFLALGTIFDSSADRPEARDAAGAPEPGPLEPWRIRLILAAFALAGFVSLSLEVLWTRLLVFELNTTVYAFSIMLTTFLAGIGLGSLAYSGIERLGWLRNRYGAFGLIEASIGVLGLLSIPLIGNLESLTTQPVAASWSEQVTHKLVLAAMIMIVPTLLMGAAFPLASRIYTTSAARIGSSVGKIYAFNTLGSICGSMLTGFVLVRLLGTQRSIVAVSLLALGVGTAVLLSGPRTHPVGRRMGWLVAPVFWIAAITLIVLTPSNLLFRFYNVGQQKINAGVELLHAHEGLECITTVHRFPDGMRVIATGSMNVAGTGLTLRTTQKLQAHVPMLLHPAPRAVLQVGFGSGETSHILTTYDTEQVDIVEISQGVLDTSDEFFADINHGVVHHPKFRAIVMDGANYLALTDRKYDVIMNDSIWPYYSGNAGLYTREYFENGRRHLNPGGIMTSWLSVDMPPAAFKSLVNTFHSVFSDISLWLAVTHFNQHALLVGSTTPLTIDLTRFLERYERYARKDLEVVHLGDPALLLDAYRTDQHAIERWATGAPLHTLDRPVLEFAPRTKTPTDWIRNYNLLVQDDATVFDRLTNLERFGGADGAFARELGATNRATKLVMRGLIKRETQEQDFVRQLELALAEKDDHPGALVLLAEIERWNRIDAASLAQYGFNDLLTLGNEFLNNNLAENAALAFGRAVELQPSSAFARHNLALALIRLGRADRALDELNEAARRQNDYAPVFRLRGTVRATMGQLAPAIEDFTRAVQLDGNDAESLINRGLAYAGQGDFDRGIADIDRALEVAPQSADAYHARAQLNEFGRRQPGRALDDYTTAITLDPTHVDALYDRAMLQAENRRFAAAIDDFTRVIELAPGRPDAYYHRGVALGLSGDPQAARADLAQAARIDPAYAAAARQTP